MFKTTINWNVTNFNYEINTPSKYLVDSNAEFDFYVQHFLIQTHHTFDFVWTKTACFFSFYATVLDFSIQEFTLLQTFSTNGLVNEVLKDNKILNKYFNLPYFFNNLNDKALFKYRYLKIILQQDMVFNLLVSVYNWTLNQHYLVSNDNLLPVVVINLKTHQILNWYNQNQWIEIKQELFSFILDGIKKWTVHDTLSLDFHKYLVTALINTNTLNQTLNQFKVDTIYYMDLLSHQANHPLSYDEFNHTINLFDYELT